MKKDILVKLYEGCKILNKDPRYILLIKNNPRMIDELLEKIEEKQEQLVVEQMVEEVPAPDIDQNSNAVMLRMMIASETPTNIHKKYGSKLVQNEMVLESGQALQLAVATFSSLKNMALVLERVNKNLPITKEYVEGLFNDVISEPNKDEEVIEFWPLYDINPDMAIDSLRYVKEDDLTNESKIKIKK